MKLIIQYVLIGVGILIILVGIAGLVLPIIPGVVLIILGLIVMGKKEVIIKWINKLPPPLNKVIKLKK